MKTRCPTCKTRYDIPPQALLEADGLARCFRCGTVFETVSEDAGTPGVIHPGHFDDTPTPEARPQLADDNNRQPQDSGAVPVAVSEQAHEALTPTPVNAPDDQSSAPADQAPAETEAPDKDSTGREEDLPLPVTKDEPVALEPSESPTDTLPFVIPENLAPLEPSPDAALDISDTLYEKKSYRGLYYGLAGFVLAAGLGLQLAWHNRKELVTEYPVLQPVCAYIECLPKVVHAPEKMSVLQRDIAPTANQPGSLTLSARIRNDADTAQVLPDIQLSLLDDNGAVLVRRRLTPEDYLFPPPPKGKLIAPGEVVTITLDFMDPGHQASGFLIGFL